LDINELCSLAYENAKQKGFYDGDPSFGALLMQVVEELGEASDADRRGRHSICSIYDGLHEVEIAPKDNKARMYRTCVKDTVESELADVFIILAGICKHRNIDIENHIIAKMRYNKTRERLHGKEY